jgi:hypothetical protein
MNNTALKRFNVITIILIITIILLEVASFVILRITSGNTNHPSELSIFKQTNKNGHIEPNQSAVIPVKENASVRWKTSEFNVMVNTNSRGLREIFNVSNAEVAVAFFGDSFTFGHGVEDNERFSYIFSKDPHYSKLKVVNFSYINGHQPECYEYFLRKNEDLRPRNVIIGLYLGNDLDSDIEETIYDRETNIIKLPYRYISSKGTMQLNPELYIFPLNYLVNNSSFVTLLASRIGKTQYREYLYNSKLKKSIFHPNREDLELGREDLKNNRAINSLVRIDKLVRERKGRLTILIIPQNYFVDDDHANAHIHNDLKNRVKEIKQGNNILNATKNVCAELGLDCYDPLAILNKQHYFKYDAHWNSEGHSVVGKALAKYIMENVYRYAGSIKKSQSNGTDY